MGVLHFVINLDKREYIFPYDEVNTKNTTAPPYSSFIVWVIRQKWNGDSILFMGDSDPCAEGWIMTEGPDDRDKTKEFWDEFKEDYQSEWWFDSP
jgi:hypothetical protein